MFIHHRPQAEENVMLRTNLKKIVCSAVFWGTVILLAGSMVLGAYSDLQNARNNSMSVLYCYLVTNSVGISHVLVPIVTIVPFTFFYVDELDKKAVYYSLIRCSKRKYYLANVLTAIISAVLVSSLAILIFVIVCLGFGANLQVDNMMVEYYSGTFFQTWIESEMLVRILLIHICSFVIFSIPWPLLSLAVSILSKNKYVIIASPFILFMAASYVTEMSSADMLNPGLMLLKGSMLKKSYGGLFYAISYHVIFSLFFAFFYYCMSKRRFLHEGL